MAHVALALFAIYLDPMSTGIFKNSLSWIYLHVPFYKQGGLF